VRRLSTGGRRTPLSLSPSRRAPLARRSSCGGPTDRPLQACIRSRGRDSTASKAPAPMEPITHMLDPREARADTSVSVVGSQTTLSVRSIRSKASPGLPVSPPERRGSLQRPHALTCQGAGARSRHLRRLSTAYSSAHLQRGPRSCLAPPPPHHLCAQKGATPSHLNSYDLPRAHGQRAPTVRPPPSSWWPRRSHGA